jgi:hypothetical protein
MATATASAPPPPRPHASSLPTTRQAQAIVFDLDAAPTAGSPTWGRSPIAEPRTCRRPVGSSRRPGVVDPPASRSSVREVAPTTLLGPCIPPLMFFLKIDAPGRRRVCTPSKTLSREVLPPGGARAVLAPPTPWRGSQAPSLTRDRPLLEVLRTKAPSSTFPLLMFFLEIGASGRATLAAFWTGGARGRNRPHFALRIPTRTKPAFGACFEAVGPGGAGPMCSVGGPSPYTARESGRCGKVLRIGAAREG